MKLSFNQTKTPGLILVSFLKARLSGLIMFKCSISWKKERYDQNLDENTSKNSGQFKATKATFPCMASRPSSHRRRYWSFQFAKTALQNTDKKENFLKNDNHTRQLNDARNQINDQPISVRWWMALGQARELDVAGPVNRRIIRILAFCFLLRPLAFKLWPDLISPWLQSVDRRQPFHSWIANCQKTSFLWPFNIESINGFIGSTFTMAGRPPDKHAKKINLKPLISSKNGHSLSLPFWRMIVGWFAVFSAPRFVERFDPYQLPEAGT